MNVWKHSSIRLLATAAPTSMAINCSRALLALSAGQSLPLTLSLALTVCAKRCMSLLTQRPGSLGHSHMP